MAEAQPMSPLSIPLLDPTPIFEHFRGAFATELLTAAVADFDLFRRLGEEGPLSPEALGRRLALADRPLTVLTTALRAMGLLRRDEAGRLALTPMAREHLLPGAPFDVSGYIGLAAESPGVAAMVARLRANKPAGSEDGGDGAAFIFREGLDSAMEREVSAKSLTLALAGRARNVAPVLAERLDLPDAKVLLDVGGGTGIYAYALLRKHPTLRAVVWDRPEVLKVAREIAETLSVADRVRLVPGDMFADPVPEADTILLSNILHDWDVPENLRLIGRLESDLPAGGRLLIHDVFLDDDLGGPLPVALYSAALFTLTEGRAYSAAEYRSWLVAAGLISDGPIVPTLVHCGVLSGRKAG